jgi:hypothetical protein
MYAKEPRYLACAFFNCGQFFSAWSSSRKMMELRVDSGMAGMPHCAARRYRAWL